MFDKMVKMRNKKAFTLVEMLIVIAIIAILVAIVVPVVGHSTQKSRAAANAANLRSIEGELSALRAQDPLAFSTALETLGAEIKVVLQERFANSGIEALDKYTNGLIDNSVNEVMDFLDSMGLNEYINSGRPLSELIRYHVYHNTADSNGTLTINTVVLNNVPAAKGVSVDGMEVEEGTPMTVYITETTISATYESGVSAYNRDDFAEVAETGAFSGTASGGLSSEGAANSANCYINGHKYVNCVCSVCGHDEHVATGNTHLCDCGKELIHKEHESVGGYCKYTDCNAKKGCSHENDIGGCGKTVTYDEDGKCTNCGHTSTYHKKAWTGYYHCKYSEWSAPVPTPST